MAVLQAHQLLKSTEMPADQKKRGKFFCLGMIFELMEKTKHFMFGKIHLKPLFHHQQ